MSLGEFARSGYCRMDVDGDNLANVTLHQCMEAGFPYSTWHLHFPIEGSSLHLDYELQKPVLYEDEGQLMYPDIAVEQNGGVKDNSTDIVHIVCMGAMDVGGGLADPSDRLWYYRYDRGVPVPDWQGPVLIDSTRILGYTIDADDNSDKVCLVYHSDYATDGMNGLNNIAYRESYTSGWGWLTGAELGPTNKNLASSYSDPAGPQAWTETSIAYDHDGDLHILYTEQRVADESGHIALKHWRQSRWGPPRTVQIAYYDNYGTWARTLNLGHISLGVGDGATWCKGGAETNEDYLYATFVKLGGETGAEQSDLSQLGYSNGELWLTASNSNGDTWAPPTNLSKTKFPECTSRRPDSLCTSEAWSSIARDVSDIEIFYIYDFEAGAFDEAPWTMNRAMYLNLPGGTQDAEHVCPIIAPHFASYISAEPECEYHANPGGVNMETLTILNLGNENMEGDINVTAGGDWLSVSGAVAYAIDGGGDDVVRDVTMDATSLSQGLYVGEIHVTHNDTSKASPRVYLIDFFVVTDFKCPQDVVLRTAVASPGVMSLEVGSYGRLASQNDEGGLWRFVDSSSTIFDATLLLAYGPQPTETGDTIVFYRFMDGNDPGQGGVRAVTDLVIDTSQYRTGSGYAKATAELHTHAEGLSPDSVLAARVEWFFPQNPVYGDFVIAKYTVWNRTGSPISDVVVGLWADLDVIEAAHMDDYQQGVDNHGNYVQEQNLIYQYGYDMIGHVPSTHLESAQRYSGGVSYLAGRDATGALFKLAQAPIRGAVGDNRDNTGPGRPSSEFFYRTIVGGPGVSVWEPTAHEDSAKDAYTWIQLDHGRTLDANGANPEVYVVAWVSDTLQHDAYSMGPKLAGGLPEVVDSAWAWAERYAFCQCSRHTDPQWDGVTNAMDVCLTVGVAFRGWAPVFDDDCPYERTDVDCTGWTNVLDVVRIVNVAFRGGSPEDNFCNGCEFGVAQVVSQVAEVTQIPDVSPGNSVVVESREVLSGATGVQLGIYIENDVSLSSMVIPLEFRTVTNGAYMSGTFNVNPSGRAEACGLLDFATILYYNTPFPQSCSGPVSSTWSGGGSAPNADGSPDAYMYAGLVTLSEGLSPGADGVPGSGNPSFLITFDANTNLGEFEIDTCCTTPANHLLFLDNDCFPIMPSFLKGVVSIVPDLVQCPRTSTDRYLLTCPRGDILFNVHLRDGNGDPIVGYSNVQLDFSACDPTEFLPQPGAYPYWPIVPAPAPSDSSGTIRFAIAAGGDCADCEVTVNTGCGFSRTVPVRSVDVNGDGCVLPNDWDEVLGMCRDLNADGVVNDVDMIRHEAHCCDHCFPAGPADWLGQRLALDPDAGFLEGDTITICWSVDNNDPTVTSSEEKALGAYRIDSVQFFQAEQAVDPAWEWLTTRIHGVMLPTSSSLYDSVEHIAPSYRDMCLQARLYSDCCDTALLEKICSSVGRQCPPAALTFEFYTRRLSDADEYILIWSDPTLLALGWDYYFNPDTIIPIVSPEPISFTEIQTSAFSDPGTSGALTIYYRVGTTWDHFSYRVLQDYYMGDICGGANRVPDCEVNVLDVVCLVDYIFRSGPPPDQLEHADMNLDGIHNVLDVVTLVDYVFRGGDPPPDPRGGPRT